MTRPQRNGKAAAMRAAIVVICLGFFGSTIADTLRPFAAVLLGFLAVAVLYGLAKWRFWR
jgi:sorbitol-specific phosphotransferase system component IIBC